MEKNSLVDRRWGVRVLEFDPSPLAASTIVVPDWIIRTSLS